MKLFDSSFSGNVDQVRSICNGGVLVLAACTQLVRVVRRGGVHYVTLGRVGRLIKNRGRATSRTMGHLARLVGTLSRQGGVLVRFILGKLFF